MMPYSAQYYTCTQLVHSTHAQREESSHMHYTQKVHESHLCWDTLFLVPRLTALAPRLVFDYDTVGQFIILNNWRWTQNKRKMLLPYFSPFRISFVLCTPTPVLNTACATVRAFPVITSHHDITRSGGYDCVCWEPDGSESTECTEGTSTRMCLNYDAGECDAIQVINKFALGRPGNEGTNEYALTDWLTDWQWRTNTFRGGVGFDEEDSL